MSRVGLGFDAHGFDTERPLILGGLTIPGPGLSGHSDADVLSHALADALLGAAALGDLGGRFPSTDEFKGADSLGLLKECTAAARVAGWHVVNADCTVIAERPKLAIYRDLIIDNLARALEVATDNVSLKATTTDGMGFTGRGEGIAAIAVVMIDSH
ncbi:MAG: 2-C-methyl-D-erythritol 2,4-cyclodiphosphate synthase [Actinomycetota bacterium]|jgi:2-C-methyl-D-erythritol 2,4-cyclodiphosphate synthase|nr:2-C-methyl-D-erythritol 2,4-cyclodiphosphate synthase [Actinomycetota bacterium]